MMEISKKENAEAKKLYKALIANQKLKAKMKAVRTHLMQRNKALRLENTALKDKLDSAHTRINTLDARYHHTHCKATQDAQTLHIYREYTIKKRRKRVDEIMQQQQAKENLAFQIVDREIPLW